MNKAIIYKIEFENEIYIGSTSKKYLCMRQAEHNNNLKNKPHQKLYKKCIENKIDKIKCIWVADIKYDTNDEKRMIEEKYRKEMNATMNSVKCYRSLEEKKEDWKKNYHKTKSEYNKNRKEKITCNFCNCLIAKGGLKEHQRSNKCKKFRIDLN